MCGRLKLRYSQGDLLRISNLQQEVSAIRQGDAFITDYFTKLRTIWDELENYKPDPICTCTTKCSCEALSNVFERKIQDQVIQFLRGLNDQYNNVRSNILMMDPSPTITKVFSYFVQQVRQILNTNMLGNLSFETKGTIINVASSSSNTQYSCTYYGKSGHSVDMCYRKYGFPSSVNSNGRGGGGRGFKNQTNHGRGMQGRGTKMCTHCGRNGHTIDVCYRKHGFPPGHRFNNSQGATVNNTVTYAKNKTEQQPVETHDIPFTSQQYQALLALIQQPSNGTPTTTTHVNHIGTTLSNSAIGHEQLEDDWYNCN